MRIKILLSLVVIVLAVSLVGAATLAWFTAATDPIDNEFTAGTVAIEAGRTGGATGVIEENWNPGDCTDIGLRVINEGSKSIYLRGKLEGRWLPRDLRLLVIYTGKSVQLLAVEWDSTAKGDTGADGPIATGEFSYVGSVPGSFSYMNGQFRNLSNDKWLSNGSGYAVWCVDSDTQIGGGWHNVQIFDPYCNEDWYTEVDTQVQWDNIPWAKIVYIINQKYLNRGYSVTDIQEAIWHFTNGDFVSGKAAEIVADVEANHELSPDNVSFNPGPDWELGPDGWYYYKKAIPGTFTHEEITFREVSLDIKLCLDGAKTGNKYQGAQYWLTAYFEAIQSSHNASQEGWGWSPPEP